jgi:hypothetical protein
MTTFDAVKICGYVATFGAGLNSLLPQTGLIPATEYTKISGVLALVVGIALLIANTLKNPTPPTGTIAAVIPLGSIPAVGSPTASGLQVAHVDAATTTVTSVEKFIPKS